ncbi:MAG: hypothetical protein ACRD2T_13755, partial [Thermoanaerobaculia bacterium]
MRLSQIRHLVELRSVLAAASALLACLGPRLTAREYLPADPSTLEAGITRAGAGLVAVLVIQGEEACPEVLAFLSDPRVERALGRSVPLVVSATRHPEVAVRFSARGLPLVLL